MIGIDLFSGPGGLSLGAKYAGIKTKIAVERDQYAAHTYAKNLKGTTVIVDDVTNIQNFKFDRKSDPELILYGGPPCQGYSNSNQKTRGLENPKNWLFKEFIRCTELLNPDWVVIENVRGLITQEKGYFLEAIIKELNKSGYTVSFKLLNASDFGVPQIRERVFIIGSLHGIAIELPNTPPSINITVDEAISDLPLSYNGCLRSKAEYSDEPVSKYAEKMRGKMSTVSNNLATKNSDLVIERYKHIPQGGNWKNIPDELMSNYKDHSRCHGGIYRRLSSDKASVVIGNYRKNMLIHPHEDRGLTVREAARLQSFPDWFEFHGPLISQQQQVGDAVPPLLAKSVFAQILKHSSK